MVIITLFVTKGVIMQLDLVKKINGNVDQLIINVIRKAYRGQAYSLFVEVDGDKSVNYEIRIFWNKKIGFMYNVWDCLCKKSQNGFEITEYKNLIWQEKSLVLELKDDKGRFSKKRLQNLVDKHLGNQFSAEIMLAIRHAKWSYEDDDRFNKYEGVAA
tara:strand:+ start:32 stop:505 length:474 start_codon:yes stop_codon:yes gene_type:complete